MIYVTTGFSPNMISPPGLSVDFVKVDIADIRVRLRQPFQVCINARTERNRVTLRRLADDIDKNITIADNFEFKLRHGDIVLICKDSLTTPNIEYWEAHCYALPGEDE